MIFEESGSKKKYRTWSGGNKVIEEAKKLICLEYIFTKSEDNKGDVQSVTKICVQQECEFVIVQGMQKYFL